MGAPHPNLRSCPWNYCHLALGRDLDLDLDLDLDPCLVGPGSGRDLDLDPCLVGLYLVGPGHCFAGPLHDARGFLYVRSLNGGPSPSHPPCDGIRGYLTARDGHAHGPSEGRREQRVRPREAPLATFCRLDARKKGSSRGDLSAGGENSCARMVARSTQ